MAVGIGINADAENLGNTQSFYDFAVECPSVLLINDLKWEHTHVLRSHRPNMLIIRRRHYEGKWEGRWRDCVHDGNILYDPPFMANVLMDGYKPEYKAWINFGNEPARHGETLKKDIDFYCETLRITIQQRVPVVVLNIQVHEFTAAEIALYTPLFKMANDYPDYVAIGIHSYFEEILSLGVGTGEWGKLTMFGSHPKAQWATIEQAKVNADEAHMGREFWLRDVFKQFPKVRYFQTECGFDYIDNLPQSAILTSMNGGQRVDGIKNTLPMLARHELYQDAQITAAENVTWMGDTLVESEALMFYAWSIQDEWRHYSCNDLTTFKDEIIAYNRKVRSGSTPPVDDDPDVPPSEPLTLEARVSKIEADLKAVRDGVTSFEAWKQIAQKQLDDLSGDHR